MKCPGLPNFPPCDRDGRWGWERDDGVTTLYCDVHDAVLRRNQAAWLRSDNAAAEYDPKDAA